MVASLPRIVGASVRALRTAPKSAAADTDWMGRVVGVVGNGEVIVRYTRPDGTTCFQRYEADEWTTENVEILSTVRAGAA